MGALSPPPPPLPPLEAVVLRLVDDLLMLICDFLQTAALSHTCRRTWYLTRSCGLFSSRVVRVVSPSHHKAFKPIRVQGWLGLMCAPPNKLCPPPIDYLLAVRCNKGWERGGCMPTIAPNMYFNDTAQVHPHVLDSRYHGVSRT